MNSDELYEKVSAEINKTVVHPVEVRILTPDGRQYEVSDVEYKLENGALYIKGE